MNSVGWGVVVTLVVLGALLSTMFPRGRAQNLGSSFTWSARGFNGASIACFGIVAVLVTGGIALASYGSAHHRQFAYTELWMVPV